MDLLFSNYEDKDVEFVDLVRRFDEKTSVRSQNYAAFSIAADPDSQVFYDADYLVKHWGRFAKVVSVTEEAYGYQTALLFQK